MKRWRIVGFKHPKEEKSLIYKQGLTDEQLINPTHGVKAIEKGIEKGCNLFSIRGFKEKSK